MHKENTIWWISAFLVSCRFTVSIIVEYFDQQSSAAVGISKANKPKSAEWRTGLRRMNGTPNIIKHHFHIVCVDYVWHLFILVNHSIWSNEFALPV